jgi:hypothetical protein
MNELEAAIQSARRATAPWDERRAAAVFDEARRRRASSGVRRTAVLFALGIAASLGALALFARASSRIDGDGPAAGAAVADTSDRAPRGSSAMGGASLADGGFVTACSSCHLDESRWRIDRDSIVHGRYE